MRRRDFLAAAPGGLTVLAAGRQGGVAAKTEKYRVAIIGRTRQGDYGHGLDIVWNDVPQAQVVAVADPDPKGLAAAARPFTSGSATATTCACGTSFHTMSRPWP